MLHFFNKKLFKKKIFAHKNYYCIDVCVCVCAYYSCLNAKYEIMNKHYKCYKKRLKTYLYHQISGSFILWSI